MPTTLVAELASDRRDGGRPVNPGPVAGAVEALPSAALLSQQALWDRVARFLRPGDIALGRAIGYTLPALLGACLACPGRRGILLIGDGAAQMTAQELSTILRAGLSPVVIVVDNDGYTIERAMALLEADRPGELALIQAVVPRMDIPPLLESLTRAASVANAARVG